MTDLSRAQSRLNDPLFDLSGRVAVITGGGGLLGRQHADAVAAAGGVPVIVDVSESSGEKLASEIARTYSVPALFVRADITDAGDVRQVRDRTLAEFGRIDILINNAANNPHVDSGDDARSRLENFPREQWDADLAVGLTGAFLCSQVIGQEMAKRGGGVILNIASDLAVIAPDQRLYRKAGLPEERQPVKPVAYSAAKAGILGLTRYLATYWADRGIRVNALSPAGVENNQSPEFMARLTGLIPLGRMARPDEYQGAVVFLCSDASSYMTGQNLVVDGGRTAW